MLSPDDLDFQAVAGQAPVAWSVIDLEGTQVVGNAFYAALFGYDVEEMSGLRIADLTRPDDRGETDDHLADLVSGSLDRYETDKRYLRKDGTEFTGHLIASLMRDSSGQPHALVAVITDVTAERALALQVSQSEERLSKMLTNISETVTLISADGDIRGTTGFHTEILGYPADFWTGTSIFDIVHPDQIDQAARLSAEVLAQPGAELHGEFRIRHQLGHYEDVELAVVNLLEDPAVGAIILTSRNVTERKAQERELVLMRDRALRLAEQRSAFVANVSHELRTPLHAVLGLAELLEQSELSPEQRSFVDAITAEASHLRETVDDLLDHARVEADGLTLEPHDVDVRDLVDAVVRRHTATDHGQDLRIEATVDPSAPREVRLDGHRVDQVLTNVVGNAVKFTAAGSVLVHVTADHGTLAVRVEDTGPGIPTEARAAVFEPFTQLPGSRSTVGGSGLGLALVRGLVDLMGGSVRLEDRRGGGTIVHLEIPFEPSGLTVDVDPTDVVAPPPSTGISILVVEDNETNQFLVRQQLARLGHHCDIAPDATDALARLEPSDHGYDVVLMDWQLPDIDGLEATRRLRVIEGDRPHVPVVAVTASAMPEDRAACRAAGMDDFLPKPVALADLSTMIDRWAPTGHRTPTSSSDGVDGEKLERLVDELGDRDIVASLVTSYLAELDKRHAALVDARRDADIEVLHRVGHTLRSTSQMLGADALVLVCREMEVANPETDLDPLMERFSVAATDARGGLSRWLEASTPGADDPADG
ncbi:PAS domain S-box protein [Actinospongicola halichondriae]|uniref:PAS domain S-box protein n=1 Tax=Actinospongicola halichondriae TaxID=3236844 RepID=UPI003D426A24